MTARRRPYMAASTYGALAVVAAFVALTFAVLRQQASHARAVAEALHHEDVRTALWRMETRVAALLALTTNRVALVEQQPGGYLWNTIDPASNMLNPAAPMEETLQSKMVDAADRAYIMACGIHGEEQGAAASGSNEVAEAPAWTNPRQQDIGNRGVQRSVDEFDRRSSANVAQQVTLANTDTLEGEFCIGPLASVWQRGAAGLELHFARRIQGPNGASHESYRLDWDGLAALLLAEIADLFPSAQLLPLEDTEAEGLERAMRLAAVPAQLVVPPPRPAEDLPHGHLWTLGGAWSALLFALVMGGLALRASYAYGDKHRRFTHAVTHELRTPLTTFRMYSEMLARGMVPPASQGEYLTTLESEATRLARLVDNVLRYARLEDVGQAVPMSEVAAGGLVERCVPELARICERSGASLEVQDLIEGDVRLRTDPEAVLQVLANLVENACKYGRPPQTDDGAAVPVVLRATCEAGRMRLDVCDEGPGVPRGVERSIFEPFDRGGRDSSDRAPGVGLGLALSRALASELGGSLALVPSARGAVFRLTLPLAS
jgi:signal transduction histidine kinase